MVITGATPLIVIHIPAYPAWHAWKAFSVQRSAYRRSTHTQHKRNTLYHDVSYTLKLPPFSRRLVFG